jgi:hypothetical protein
MKRGKLGSAGLAGRAGAALPPQGVAGAQGGRRSIGLPGRWHAIHIAQISQSTLTRHHQHWHAVLVLATGPAGSPGAPGRPGLESLDGPVGSASSAGPPGAVGPAKLSAHVHVIRHSNSDDSEAEGGSVTAGREPDVEVDDQVAWRLEHARAQSKRMHDCAVTHDSDCDAPRIRTQRWH